MRDDNSMSYIGRAPCGCVRAAMYDDIEDADDRKFMAQELARWIRAGLTIEHVTHAYVRENFCSADRCPHCVPKPEQLKLELD